MISSRNTTHTGHWTSTSLGMGKGVDKESNKELHRKEWIQSKSLCPSHKRFYIFSLKLIPSFLVSHEALIILLRATKRAHSRKNRPVYLKYLYNIWTKILYFHCFVNVGCLYIHKGLKIQLCLKMWFSTSFYITWYVQAAYMQKVFFSLIL